MNNLQAINDKAGKQITDARAWRGAEIADSDWVTQLAGSEVDALHDMAAALPSDELAWLNFDPGSIKDAAVVDVLQRASTELAQGKGFVLLRGLDANDIERLRRVFWIIGNGLGEPVMQNARGEGLSIVADRFAGAERGVDTRGYESNDELRFHCDGGDCIGMSCIRQAPVGGTNGLVSLFALYNEVLASYPQYLDVLMQGYPLYSRKEKGAPESTKNLGKVQPSQLTFKQEPGDVLFINNMAVMHRRDKYVDAENETQKRMLYRMWINLHKAQPVVAQHAALRRGIRGQDAIIAAA